MNFEHLSIIDLQEGFQHRRPHHEFLRCVFHTQRLIQWGREKRIPIAYITYAEFGDLLPGLIPKNNEPIITKVRDDAFTESEYTKLVAPYGILCFAGCFLEACIRDTVMSAVKHNHTVVMYAPAILASQKNPERTRETIELFTTNPSIHYLNIVPPQTLPGYLKSF